MSVLISPLILLPGVPLPGEFAPACGSQPHSSDPTTLGAALPSPRIPEPACWVGCSASPPPAPTHQ